jgi:23S rRNA (uracil1939-C5)-methyltransferase
LTKSGSPKGNKTLLSNKIHKVEIEKMTFGGLGMGYIDGKVCFVPRVVPGETVEVEIKKEKADYFTSRLLKVIISAPERIEEICPYGKFCPGCSYQHMDYDYENKLKDQQMREFIFRSLPQNDCQIASPLAPENPHNYRNKLILHADKEGGRTLLGYRYADGQTVLDIEQCPLACDEINAELAELRSNKGFFHSLHKGQSFTLRYTSENKVIYWRNAPSSNLSWLKEDMPFGKFSVPAGCFHQVNNFGAAALVNNVTRIIEQEKPEVFVDLYCGSGLFATTAAAAGVSEVNGIEQDKEAAAAASYNLKNYGSKNSEIVAADATRYFARITDRLPESTLLTVDPPRRGLATELKNTIVRSRLKRLIYISCGPDTLARDLKMLHSHGFNLKFVQMINMFPRTSHFETFSYLTRD